MMNDGFKTGVIVGLLAPLIVFLIAVPLILLKAWVLTYLWAWYIVPLFGAPHLSMIYAFGLSLTINYLITSPKTDKKSEASDLFVPFVSPFLVLLVGWIGTWFM